MKLEIVEPLGDEEGGKDPMCNVKVVIELGFYELDGAFNKGSFLRTTIDKWKKERWAKRLKEIDAE